ncbi:hypothetical protein TSUD_294250 [Trifolium subterraneum]|uniref:Uncharacterized protein n=1 Tax=Trifolium subterraneum TaxID=3900 RepID=A0A2Z6N4R2_TRISU|nr:hypothetical protein TSUD_294250 [Trifolium subterraneum]
MNPTLPTTLSFLFFALTTYFPLAFTQVNKLVQDTDGNPLGPGYKYYISQTTTSGQEGGGLMLGYSGTGQSCALTVLQEFCEDHDGLPVRFNVTNGGFAIFEDEFNIEIEFVNKPKCAQSSKWMVVENFDNFHTKWITIGSLEDHGGNTKFIDSVFKIKKQGKGYKFVFYSEQTTYDVKRFNDVNGRRLAANGFASSRYHPFEVEFVNAEIYRRRSVV